MGYRCEIMKTRLFICLGVVGLLAWGAAAPGFAYAQANGQERPGGRPDYQRQDNQQQYQRQQNAGQYGWRGVNRSAAEEQDRTPRWQAQPNWRANAQDEQDNRGQDQRRLKKQKKRDAEQERNRTPSSLLPQDEKRRSVMQQFMPHDRARQAVEAGEIRSLGEIRRTVQQRFNGRIVRMDLRENQGGGPSYVYDVRVLTQRGDVLSVDMDARTGRVLRVKGGR